MSFSMMTIQPSIPQEIKDDEARRREDKEWERKKLKQQTQMAIARQSEFPRGPSSTTQGGVAGIGSIGEQLRAQGVATQPIKYPAPNELNKFGSAAEFQAAKKQAVSNFTAPGFGMGFPAKPQPATPSQPIANMQGRGVMRSTSDKEIADKNNLASALTPVTSADNSPISDEQGNKSYGLSITPSPDKNSAAQDFAAAMQGSVGNAIGFDVPNAPRRGTAEAKERAALIKQASTVQAGARGITAAQMNVLSGLQNNDDKFANDQYQAQLGAASNMAQAQLREGSANARAALGEASAGERQSQQLGFDADKFQQSTSLDNRRLDIAQADSDVKNFSTKERNALYKQWETAETDEDKNAILAKMNTLSGTGDGEKWKAIKGAQTIEGGLPIDGAPLLLNERTGETRPIDGGPIQLDMGNPKVAAIMNDTKTNYEQKMAALDALNVVTQ